MKAFLIISFFFGILINGQNKFNPHINKDSLFEKILIQYPDNQSKIELKNLFSKSNSEGKEYILAVMYNSNYTKKDLIENIEKHSEEFIKFKNEYSKLVPKNLIIQTSIVTNDLIIPKKIVSIVIYKIKDGYINNSILNDISNIELVSRNDNLLYKSEELEKVLAKLNWNEETLNLIESNLNKINSFSIRNGNPTLIKFKRVGIGFLSYKVFDNNLTKQEITENNDGCNHIFYKNNLVLVSDNGQDGARGALCFSE